MIIPDANLLLYAYNSSIREHAAAKAWWEKALSSSETVGLPWQVITAFLRIATNHRAFPLPLTIEEAAEAVSEWLACPMVRVVDPGERHWVIFQQLLNDEQCMGPLVMDAHLAAIAMEQGATLYTHDRDFHRFSALRTIDPLL